MKAKFYRAGQSTMMWGKPEEVLQLLREMREIGREENRPEPLTYGLGQTNWNKVRMVCKNGMANKVLPVGTLLHTEHRTIGGILWRVCKATEHRIWLVATRPVCDFIFDAEEQGKNSDTGENNPSKCRVDYGYNSWRESAVRQWLNSKSCAGNWWNPQNAWDTEPDCSRDVDAFAAGIIDQNFLYAVAETEVVTSCGDGQKDTTKDSFFLLSYTEVFGDANGGVQEGGKLDLGPGFCKDCYWWLRSPNVGTSNYVYLVSPSGSLDVNLACYTYGVAPACVIG